jgi:CheY-like chemotaxis protein
LDGLDAARQIQAAAAIPIIFMTGYPDAALEAEASALQPLGYFRKPVPLYELYPLLETLARQPEGQRLALSSSK